VTNGLLSFPLNDQASTCVLAPRSSPCGRLYIYALPGLFISRLSPRNHVFLLHTTKLYVSTTVSTASTSNASAQTTVPGSGYQVNRYRKVSVLSGRPMSAAKISLFLASRDVELHPFDKPHTIPNETDMDSIDWSSFSHIEDNTSEAAATTRGSVTTNDDAAPMALHKIFSKSATAERGRDSSSQGGFELDNGNQGSGGSVQTRISGCPWRPTRGQPDYPG
jgi:hypothetical protein